MNRWTVSGCGSHSVAGYTVQAWDGTAGTWGAPVSGAGDTDTCTDGISPAKVRLAWKWTGDGAVLLIR